MKKMIDPSTIKVDVDTSNLAKLNTANHFKINKTDSNQIVLDINSSNQTQISVVSEDNTSSSRYGAYFPRIGVYNTSYEDALYMNPREGKTAFIRKFGGYFNLYTLPFTNTNDTTHNLLSNKTVKTIFGTSIYSANGTGNIDLYAHDITITKGTGKAFLTVYSSKNTNIDSLDVLKTIAGATFTKSCTGYINSKVIVAITETSFLLADGTTEALTGATFVDAPTAI